MSPSSLCGIFIIISFAINPATCNNATYRLFDKLFTNSNYNRQIRPVVDHRDLLDIKLRFELFEIIQLQEHLNRLTISGLIEAYWSDAYLTWNPDDFDGISEVFVPASDVWKPVFALFNSSAKDQYATANGEVELKSDGKIEVQIPFYWDVICLINVGQFPFDRQNCSFLFGSLSRFHYTAYWLELADPKNVMLNDFRPNTEWSLTKTHLAQKVSLHLSSDDVILIIFRLRQLMTTKTNHTRPLK